MYIRLLVLTGILATGSSPAQNYPYEQNDDYDPYGDDVYFDDVMGDDYYELPADATDLDRRNFSRTLARSLLSRVSDSYWEKKHALDDNWSNGVIDRPQRDVLLATLDETTKVLRSQVRGSDYENMMVDELLVFAQNMVVDTDSSFGQIDIGMGPAPNTDSCQCFKSRYLDAGMMQVCQSQMVTMDANAVSNLAVACRSANIDDPLADALFSCRSYSDEFNHELTGELVTRRVERRVDSCWYAEDMPGGYQMACVWTGDEERAEIAQYFRYAEFYADAKMTSHTVFRDGEPVTETRYELDGEVWNHPLQEDLEDGTCTVGQR